MRFDRLPRRPIPCDQPTARTMSGFKFNDAPRFEIFSLADQIPDPSLGIAETREGTEALGIGEEH
jgi:hypothetical protein